jgi:hypothetical protein
VTPTPFEPPRVVASIVDLVAPADRRDAILGDLREEAASIARREGSTAARRWYRRQGIRTAARLALSPFLDRPLSTAAWGVAALALAFTVGVALNAGSMALVSRYSIYHVVPAAVFWRIADSAAWLIAGWIVGRTATERSIAIALAMCALLVLSIESRLARGALMWALDPSMPYFRMAAPPLMEALVHPLKFAALLFAGVIVGCWTQPRPGGRDVHLQAS